MPILGNACFLPMVSILLSIFDCNKAVGDDFNDSYLRRDCNTRCWEDSHLIFAILSGVGLIVYMPFAIYFRPYWQFRYSHINIETRPLFLMLKSVFQVAIICLNKTIKIYNQSLHGLIYLLFLSGFLVITWYRKPFNYQRCNLWTYITIMTVM